MFNKWFLTLLASIVLVCGVLGTSVSSITNDVSGERMTNFLGHLETPTPSLPEDNDKGGVVEKSLLHENGMIKAKWSEDENGVKQGEYWSWHDNGILSSSGSYINGFKNGEWKSWYADGTMLAKGHYVGFNKIGLWVECRPAVLGPIVGAGEYVEGRREGVWVWTTRNGSLRTVETYADGALDGYWASWSPKGYRLMAGKFVSGSRDGLWKWWDADGQVYATQVWADRKLVSETNSLKDE